MKEKRREKMKEKMKDKIKGSRENEDFLRKFRIYMIRIRFLLAGRINSDIFFGRTVGVKVESPFEGGHYRY